MGNHSKFSNTTKKRDRKVHIKRITFYILNTEFFPSTFNLKPSTVLGPPSSVPGPLSTFNLKPLFVFSALSASLWFSLSAPFPPHVVASRTLAKQSPSWALVKEMLAIAALRKTQGEIASSGKKRPPRNDMYVGMSLRAQQRTITF